MGRGCRMPCISEAMAAASFWPIQMGIWCFPAGSRRRTTGSPRVGSTASPWSRSSHLRGVLSRFGMLISWAFRGDA